MKTLKYYFKKAQKEKFAIGQFNFSDWSQVKGIVEASKNLKAPIILGTSEGESRFVGLREAVAMRDALRKKTGLPIFLNLDHGKSLEYLKEAILAGYDMVHFDGSKLPIEENIKISKQVVAFAKWHRLRQGFGGQGGVLVEGEMGKIGTDASRVYQEKFEIKESDLTKPEDAQNYARQTGVDILAVSVGTFHGIDVTGISPNIRLDRLKEIEQIVGIPLVLHGGSGTPEEDLKEAIKRGIVKVNINTETRIAFTDALRKSLELHKDEIVPYKYFPEAIDAVRQVVEKNIQLFGGANKI